MSFVTPSRLLIAVAVIGLSLGTVLAQQPVRRPGGFGGGFTQPPSQEKLSYLANAAVQKELELADDQKTDIAKISEEARTKGREVFAGIDFQSLRDLSQEERDKRMAPARQKGEALAKDIAKKVEAVLLPHQTERLQEIYVQVRGVDVLTNDADIAKTLAITEQQKEKLTAIREETRSSFGQRGQANTEAERAAARERFAAQRKEREEKSLAVLTNAQKEQFAKMKGEPFAQAAELRTMGFGFGGGQGRPGGQGGQGGQPQRTRPGGNNPPNS
jgi:hypothetical protein